MFDQLKGQAERSGESLHVFVLLLPHKLLNWFDWYDTWNEDRIGSKFSFKITNAFKNSTFHNGKK